MNIDHKAIIFLSFLFSFIPIANGLLEHIQEWEQYWSRLCAGQVDLSQSEQWQDFLRIAGRRFTGSSLFRPETTLAHFVHSVFTLSLRGEKNIPGLYSAKLLLQYAPLDLSPEHLPKIKENPFGPANPQVTFNELPLPEINWGPVGYEAALDTILMCRNLGLPCAQHDLATQLRSDLASLYADAMHGGNMLLNLPGCKERQLGRDMLPLKTVANFLGDGAIDGEVDIDGRNLEGARVVDTACVLAKLLERLSSKRELVEKAGLKDDELQRDIGLFYEAAASNLLFNRCALEEKPHEVFEKIILEQLRQLQVGKQILLHIGFTKHAMVLSIRRTDPIHYDLLIFNSGSGLHYHAYKIRDSKTKVLPAKLFANLTLMNIKWSQVLQRIFQVTAIGFKIIANPEDNSITYTSAYDLYVTALAGLVRFERHLALEEEDILFRFFSAQRSGTCSVEVLMAFLAFDVGRPYNVLKLLLYKDLIDLTFAIDWDERDRPVIHRLLKYGIENHARSVLRFHRRKKGSLTNILLRDLLPADLWSKYKLVKDEYLLPKPKTFNADVEELAPSEDFHKGFLETANRINDAFSIAKQSIQEVQFIPDAYCENAANATFGNCPFDLSLSYIAGYMKYCRLRENPAETLMFLAITVTDRWPDPDAQYWKDMLGQGNPEHEARLNDLWRFVQDILQAQHESGKSNVYVYACLHKIMMIYQHVLGVLYPKLLRCNSQSTFYVRKEAYQCLSGDVVDYFRKYASKATVPCFNQWQPDFYLMEILKKLARTYQTDYQNFDDQSKYLAVLHHRQNDAIPAALYYWHVCKKIVAHVEGMERHGWNQSLPRIADKSYHPFADTLDILAERGPCDFTEPMRNLSEPPIYMSMMATLKKTIDRQMDSEAKLYANVLMTSHDQLGKFSHMLHVVPETFTWAATLHIGAAVAYHPHALDTLTEAINHINQLIDELRAELYLSISFLAQPSIRNPVLKQKCELYSGLIVVESILANHEPYSRNSKKHLSDVMIFLTEVELHDTYKALMVFTYLASLPLEMTEKEADNVILLHRKLQSGLKWKLPSIGGLDQYLDHIQANVIRAFYKLTQTNFRERLRQFVDPVQGELAESKYIFTTQKTSSGYYFDLISGAEIINGSLTSILSVDDLNQFYVTANINDDLRKFKFSTIQHQYLGQSQLITCAIGKGSRVITKGRQLYELVNIEILITNADTETTVYIGEKYAVSTEGRPDEDVYAIRLPSHKGSISRIPIPAILDDGSPYHILAFPTSSEMAFVLGDEDIWVDSSGLLTFNDRNLKDLQFLPFAGNEFNSPLASYKDVFAFKATDDSYRLLFRNYADSIGHPLWFISSHDTWKLLSDHKLRIAHNQDFTASGMLPKYLLLVGEGNVHKAIIPVEHYQLEMATGDWNDDYDHLRKSCFNISLTKVARAYDETEYLKKLSHLNNQNASRKHKVLSMIPRPKSRQESLLLLYSYLVTRHYYQAMKEADKIHQLEPFDKEEYRLLGWIVQSHLATKNGSPESIAIRSFTCFHVFNNEMLFHSFDPKNKNLKQAQNFNPYMPGNQWNAFWAEKHVDIASQCVPMYIDRLKKIPFFFRFDPDAPFNRVSSTQWTTWLMKILDEPAKNANNIKDLKLYLGPMTQVTLNSALYQPDENPEEFHSIKSLVREMVADQDSTNTSNYSFVNPSVLLTGRNHLFAKIIIGGLDSETNEKLYQWMEPYENTFRFSIVAHIIKNALLLSQEEIIDFIGEPCSPIFEMSQYHNSECEMAVKKLIEHLRRSNNRWNALNENSLTYLLNEASNQSKMEREIRTFKEKAYVADLTTPLIGDNIFGLSFPMKDIKNYLCEGDEKKVDSLLNSFVKNLSDSPNFTEHNFDLFVHFREILDFDGKLKFIQQMMRIYEQKIFTDFVTCGYPNYDSGNEDDQMVVKGLETLAHGQLTITSLDIIHMYTKSQSEYYRQYFPYFDGDANQLHELATKFVLVHSNQQEIKRLRDLLTDSKRFALEACERTRSTDTTMNYMLAYECYINSRLTAKQVDDIIEMTTKNEEGKYPDIFVQWIMSAGKTYILGTLLSVMKADHENLSILVVPKALLTGEASNLFSRTIAAFNRDGFSFRLARDQEIADLATLKWVKESLSNAKKRGQYIIMAADMLQSLHDKFVELGQDDNSQTEYNEICDILRMVLLNGALTIDEAHKIFEPTQETNYPILTSKADTADGANTLAVEAKALTEVFRILSTENGLTQKLEGKEFIKNIPIDLNTESNQIIDTIGQYLADRILEKDNRWFPKMNQKDLKALHSISQEELQDFLKTDSTSLNASQITAIKSKIFSPDLYRALAVCRMAITSWIPLAWSGNVNENYGLEPGKKYSIPFSGAFAPKIGSEFAFRWYCYARTIRTYLVNGFDDVTINWAMDWLQKLAIKEISKKQESRVANEILNTLFGLNSPSKLNLESKEQMDAILLNCQQYHRSLHEAPNLKESTVHAYADFLFSWIAEDVIPSIDYYSQQISTNSQDISYMVNSRQLYSGSVVSIRNFPRQFLDPKKVKLDNTIDPSIRRAVIDNNLGVSVVPDGLSADKFVSNLSDAIVQIQIANPVVAILDVGAYFKDQKNEEVAASLLNIQESVFYFSTSKNKLALITKDDPNEKLLHTYSAETIKELAPDEGKRITFYDQQHNTGVDIFQHVNGCALIIIGAKTTSIDFYQAVMRMRKFLETQKLFIIIPEHVSKIIPKTAGDYVENILLFLESNLKESVISLNAMALSQMIGAIFKEAAYRKLLMGEIDKEVFDLWIKDTSSDVNDLVVPQRYQNYQEHIVPKMISSYVDRVRKYFNENELADLQKIANDTVRDAFGDKPDQFYPKECLCVAPFAEGNTINDEGQSQKVLENNDTDMLAIASVETESSLKMETENEQETLATPPIVSIINRIDWNESFMPLIFNESYSRFDFRSLSCRPGIFKVNDILNANSDNPKIFSDSLMMTSGFAQRGAVFGQNRKFIPHCLISITSDGHRFLVLVDQYEADEISEIINSEENNEIFSNPAALIDPVRRVVNRGTNQYKPSTEWLQDFESLLWEAVFFAGYMKVLARPDAKEPILNFLGSSEESKSLKSALLTEIIISRQENVLNARSFPGNKSFIQYMDVPVEPYKKWQKSHYLALYNFLSHNRSRLSSYIAHLQEKVKIYGFRDIFEKNDLILQMFSKEELLETLKVAVRKFFADPSLTERDDCNLNATAVVYFAITERITPTIASGAVMVLDRIATYPNWKVYEDIFRQVANEIQMYPTEKWAKDYMQALYNFPEPHLYPTLFVAMIPETAPEGFEDLVEYHVRMDNRIVSALLNGLGHLGQPRQGITSFVWKLLKIYSDNLPVVLEETIYRSIVFVESIDYEKASLTHDDTLAIIDKAAKRILGDTIIDRPWFDLNRFACINFKEHPEHLLPIGRLLKEDEDIVRAADAFAQSDGLDYSKQQALSNAIVKHLAARGCLSGADAMLSPIFTYGT